MGRSKMEMEEPGARPAGHVRRRWGSWVAVGALVVVAAVAATVSAVTSSAHLAPAPTAVLPPAVSASGVRAWKGHGNLAVVSRGKLVVLRDDGTAHVVSGPPRGGFDSSPEWSADGRWLAFLHQAPATGFSVPPPSLWVVAAGARTARRPTRSPVGTFAWSPTSDRMAYTTVDPSTGYADAPRNLWTDIPGRSPVAVGGLGPETTVQSMVWSPKGRELALGVAPPEPPRTAPGVHTGRLLIVPAAGGHATTVAQQVGSGITVAEWWPDAQGLLYWVDTGFSSSIAADGLPLDSVPLSGGTPTTLATTLVGDRWLAVDSNPGANRVAVVAGAGRYVWMSDRHVEVCHLPAARCTPVQEAAGSLTLAPAWTATGTLLTVEASARPPFGSFGGSLGPASMAAWDSTDRLVQSTAPAWTTTGASAAGSGVVLAVPARTGTAVLLVRADAVWLWHPSAHTDPVRIAGPLAVPMAPTGYDGEFDWASTVAWTAAGGSRGGRAHPNVMLMHEVP